MDRKDGQWVAKIADFGLARSVSSVSIAQFATSGYASPEQLDLLSDKPLGPESDLFSYGMVLYELLTGDQPTAAQGLRDYGKWLGARQQPPAPSHGPPRAGVVAGARSADRRSCSISIARRASPPRRRSCAPSTPCCDRSPSSGDAGPGSIPPTAAGATAALPSARPCQPTRASGARSPARCEADRPRQGPHPPSPCPSPDGACCSAWRPCSR